MANEPTAEPTAEERVQWAAPWTDAELDDLGVRSVTSGGRIFCGVRAEAFAIQGVTYGWTPGSRIKWGIQFSRLGQLSDMDCKDAITHALLEISSVCDITHEYIANADFANLYLIAQRLDGPSGVLADCEIPQPKARPEGTRLRMRFDDGDQYELSANPQQGFIDFYRVFLHEAEHAHGLGHKPANIAGAALIAPTYSRTIRNLQQLDIDELVRRHGKAKNPPSPLPPPTNPGIGKPVFVRLEQEGREWSGSIPRVK